MHSRTHALTGLLVSLEALEGRLQVVEERGVLELDLRARMGRVLCCTCSLPWLAEADGEEPAGRAQHTAMWPQLPQKTHTPRTRVHAHLRLRVHTCVCVCVRGLRCCCCCCCCCYSSLEAPTYCVVKCSSSNLILQAEGSACATCKLPRMLQWLCT